jgi:uncharacterized membrane protein YeaQ/YmgE (transglycosylase-associated protein family)
MATAVKAGLPCGRTEQTQHAIGLGHHHRRGRGLYRAMDSPSPNNPRGFVLTTVLGIIGSIVATFIGRAIHWYGPGQGAGLIASVVGAVIVLGFWHALARGR